MLKKICSLFITLTLVVTLTPLLHAQESANDFQIQFNRFFDYSSSRLLALAEEMPEDLYSWRPQEDTRSFAEVCIHIAQSNYYYPSDVLGYPLPENTEADVLSSSLTDKSVIIDQLEQSIEFVRSVMEEIPESKLNESVQMYGQVYTGRGVLMQLITHKGEHLGQIIAYARMNDIVPPWNE